MQTGMLPTLALAAASAACCPAAHAPAGPTAPAPPEGEGAPPAPPAAAAGAPSFGDDLAFLREHTEIVVIEDESGRAQVAVAPGYQGRVMTSSAAGPSGTSFGWIHRSSIASAQRVPHMNVFGGEDRFWLGPEGGQYSIYFAAGDPFDLDHWQVPEPIDWGAWDVTERARDHVAFRKSMQLTNYAGARFDLTVDRTVRVLGAEALRAHLPVAPGADVAVVAFESDNTITNTGAAPWRRDTGLVSIWILGMFVPSPETTVVIPVRPGPSETLGPVVNDAYFGRVPPERLVVRDRVLFFRGDGAARGKIGIPRPRALPVLGSWDAARGVLTIVQFTLPDDATDYVNSLWELQREPYRGDVANSYNDGPPAPGATPLGPFYELESSSPAAALAPGARATHVHRTIHLQGSAVALDPVARAVLGVGLDEIAGAFATAAP